MTKKYFLSLLSLSLCLGITACAPSTVLPGGATVGQVQEQVNTANQQALDFALQNPKIIAQAKKTFTLLKQNSVAFKPVFQILSSFGIKQVDTSGLMKLIAPPNVKKIVKAYIGDQNLDPSKVTFDGERFLIDKTETKNVLLGAKSREQSLLKTTKFQTKLDKAAEKVKEKIKASDGILTKTAPHPALLGAIGGKKFKNSRALFSPESRANAGKLASEGIYLDQTLYCVLEDNNKKQYFVKFVIPGTQIAEMAKALNDPVKAKETISVGMNAKQVDKTEDTLFKTLSTSDNPENLVEVEEMEEILEDLLAPELSTAPQDALDDLNFDEAFLKELETEYPELAGDLFDGEDLSKLGEDELDELFTLADAYADDFEAALEVDGYELYDDEDYYDAALAYLDEFEDFDTFEDYELSDEELAEYIDFFDDEFDDSSDDEFDDSSDDEFDDSSDDEFDDSSDDEFDDSSDDELDDSSDDELDDSSDDELDDSSDDELDDSSDEEFDDSSDDELDDSSDDELDDSSDDEFDDSADDEFDDSSDDELDDELDG